MLTRFATALPVAPFDALFGRLLNAAAPRVKGAACSPGCDQAVLRGLCSCQNGCWADRYVDDCTGAFCFCTTCPTPPC